jgi:hypothetical protein
VLNKFNTYENIFTVFEFLGRMGRGRGGGGRNFLRPVKLIKLAPNGVVQNMIKLYPQQCSERLLVISDTIIYPYLFSHIFYFIIHNLVCLTTGP